MSRARHHAAWRKLIQPRRVDSALKGRKNGGIPPHGGVNPPLHWARLAGRRSALHPGRAHSPASSIGGTTGEDEPKARMARRERLRSGDFTSPGGSRPPHGLRGRIKSPHAGVNPPLHWARLPNAFRPYIPAAHTPPLRLSAGRPEWMSQSFATPVGARENTCLLRESRGGGQRPRTLESMTALLRSETPNRISAIENREATPSPGLLRQPPSPPRGRGKEGFGGRRARTPKAGFARRRAERCSALHPGGPHSPTSSIGRHW